MLIFIGKSTHFAIYDGDVEVEVNLTDELGQLEIKEDQYK